MYTNIILAATTSSTIATTTTSPEINHIVPQLEHNHKSSMTSSNDTFSIAKTIASPTTTQPSLIVKASKDWVLPPRPKPGRKQKENTTTTTNKESKPKKKYVKKSQRKKELLSSLNSQQQQALHCHEDLSANIDDLPSLMKNISIIDSENMELKSHLLSLIHEYKHLKDIVFKQPIDMFSHNTTPISTTATTTTTTTPTASTTTSTTTTTSTSTTTPEVLSAISLQPSLSSVSSSNNNNQDDPLHQYSSIPSPGSPMSSISTPLPSTTNTNNNVADGSVSTTTTTTSVGTPKSSIFANPLTILSGSTNVNVNVNGGVSRNTIHIPSILSLDSNVHKRSFDELSEFIDYSEGCSGSGSDGEGELILDLSRTTSSYSDQYLMNV